MNWIDLRSDTVTLPTEKMRAALWHLAELVMMFMVKIRR
jgi:threonine aldolase